MNNLIRALPFLWPHRRKLYLSVVFAILVAMLWGANLSVAYPVLQVLLRDQTLSESIDEKIAEVQAEVDKKSANLERIDEQAATAEREKDVDQLRDQARQSRHLSSASRELWLLTWLKNNVVPWLPEDKFNVLAWLMVALLVATVLKGFCTFVQQVLVGSVAELTVMGIRKECFRRALALDYQTVSMTGTPDLMARFTHDMTVLAHGVTLVGGKVIQEPLKAVACLSIAFYVNWRLTLLSLLMAPVIGVVFYRIGRLLKHASRRLMEHMSRIYKTLEETFDGFKVVVAFNAAQQHRRRFHEENKRYYAKALKIVKLDALTSPAMETLGMFVAFLALMPGAYLVLRDTTSIWGIRLSSGPMGIEDLGTLYVLLAGVIDPARKLSTTYSKVKRASAAADRVFAFIDRQSLVKQSTHPVALPRHSQSIVFRNVDFSYATFEDVEVARPAALQDVTLEFAAGEVVAVVGENGSGKSTLVNLIPRYYDPSRGAVLIDGIDIREVRLKELRGQIGVVTQETLLFDDTIYENIRYGKPSATRREIEQAARHAHVTQFVEQLPDKFETCVGEKGGRLSGGQRQRIALARAILRDPSILILDEATSAIDVQSERLIHETLCRFVRGRTTFLITHSVRPSLLEFVTQIVVMERGRPIAVGPHDVLIQSCPIYQRLFHSHLPQGDTQTVSAAPLEVAASQPANRSPLPSEEAHIIPMHTARKPASAESDTDHSPDAQRPPLEATEFRAEIDQPNRDDSASSQRPTGSDG